MSNNEKVTAHNVLEFWFEEIDASKWWKKSAKFDQECSQRFADVLEAAKQGELFSWRESATGRLAEIIVLDQFSRNIFRDQAEAFAADTVALVLAQEALTQQFDEQLAVQQRNFLFMPFMHSESRAVHAFAEELFRQKCSANTLKFELKHKAIIDRFGRYPHRNEILGRESTDEEKAFLQQPGSSF